MNTNDEKSTEELLFQLVHHNYVHSYVFLLGVRTHLDYINAILINLSQREIQKLQRIQNMAAKIIV